mgnify:FL=1
MKKGISKVKICISLDTNIYHKLQKISNETDAKVSTKINSILYKSLSIHKYKKRGK